MQTVQKTVRLIPGALAVAAVAVAVGPARAATINVGSDTTNGFTLDKLIDSDTDGQDLIDTDTSSNPNALAFSNTSSAGDGVGAHWFHVDSQLGLISPGDENYTSFGAKDPVDGDTKTLIYRFEPDAGFKITGAVVDHNLNVVADSSAGGSDGMITSSWSTDNVTYTQISQITSDNGNGFERDLGDHDLSDTGFSEAQELYLKYDLTRTAGSTKPQQTQVFRTDPSTGDDGFQVQLDLAAVPEPGSLALLGVGGLVAFGRRRRRAAATIG